MGNQNVFRHWDRSSANRGGFWESPLRWTLSINIDRVLLEDPYGRVTQSQRKYQDQTFKESLEKKIA